MKYKLLKLKSSEHYEWDKFVDNSIEGTIYHKTTFLNSAKINLIFITL